MALIFTSKGSLHSGTDLSTYATGAFTPSASTLLIAAISNGVSGTPNEPVLTGHGTWTKIATYLSDSSGTQWRESIWALVSSASPSSATLSCDFAGQAQAACNIEVIEVPGAVISSIAAAIIQNKTGTVNGSGTSESLTLNSALNNANNAFVGLFHHQANEAHTATTGTIIVQAGQAGPSNNISIVRSIGGNVGAVSWTTSAGKGSIGIEIVAAVTIQSSPITIGGVGSLAIASQQIYVSSVALTAASSLSIASIQLFLNTLAIAGASSLSILSEEVSVSIVVDENTLELDSLGSLTISSGEVIPSIPLDIDSIGGGGNVYYRPRQQRTITSNYISFNSYSTLSIISQEILPQQSELSLSSQSALVISSIQSLLTNSLSLTTSSSLSAKSITSKLIPIFEEERTIEEQNNLIIAAILNDNPLTGLIS